MKKLVLTTITALVLGTLYTPASACEYRAPRAVACQPYKVCTTVVSQCRQQRVTYDYCGNRYCVWVNVVTYQDVYSNGRYVTYTRTYQA